MTTKMSEGVQAAAAWVSAQVDAQVELGRVEPTEATRALHQGQAAGLAYGLHAMKMDPGAGRRAAELFSPLTYYRGTQAIRALEGYRVGHAVALAVVEYARSRDGGE